MHTAHVMHLLQVLLCKLRVREERILPPPLQLASPILVG